MANDRIYIRCKSCGKKLNIGKSMAHGFYYPGYVPLGIQLNKFYEQHEFCNGGDEGNFDIAYESEKEKKFEQEVIHCKPAICIPKWCPYKEKLESLVK